MVRKIKQRTLDRELIRVSLLAALRQSYLAMKNQQINQLKSTWIGEKGQICWLGDPDKQAQRIIEASNEYNRIRQRYDGFVQLMYSSATDEELVDFLENYHGEESL